MLKKILPIFFILVTLSTLLAHEYILLAYTYWIKKGDELKLHLFVSDGFNIMQEKPFQKSMSKGFGIITEKGETNLLNTAIDGKYPILTYPVDFNGLGLIHMERNIADITLSNKDFLHYLKEDNIQINGLDTINLTQQREIYSRYLKTLVSSKTKENDTLYKLVLGQEHEIVLLDNPYLMKKGDTLTVKILFKNNPVADKVVTARNRTRNLSAIEKTATTDKNGICTFVLEREGEWFIHSIYMTSYSLKDNINWESFWASYVFAIK